MVHKSERNWENPIRKYPSEATIRNVHPRPACIYSIPHRPVTITHPSIVKQWSSKGPVPGRQTLIPSAAVESNQDMCRDLAGLYLTRQYHSSTHAFLVMLVAITHTDVLIWRGMGGNGVP